MRWPIYLIVSFVMQIVAWIITPLLPLFAVHRLGAWDNNSYQTVALRLPKWLAWFDTPDNSIQGDSNWILAHPAQSYWNQVAWLYRNSLYGFKWTVLAAPMNLSEREVFGESPTWKSPGFQRITIGKYWQWHLVKVIGPFIINLNLGWLLNDSDQTRALFLFSPRVRLFRQSSR